MKGKKADAVAQFEVLSRQLFGRRGNYKENQSEESAVKHRFERGTSKIKSRDTVYSI
jgi:hypothetical protein